MENIKYPKRAIITVGKPDGHKQIHIGHLAGGLINSDIFARFLRNRIGKENVLFFSGTECYGTAVYNEYLKNREQFKSIQDYIYFIHLQQKAILDKFKISLDGFFCDISDIKLHYIHSYLCQRFADCLFANGDISEKNEKILIDRDTGDFLNYRQIRYKNGNKQFTGKKYSTENVENMISSSSQKTPLKREVKNYFIKFSNREKKLIQLFDKKYQYISKYITNVLKEKREDIRLTSNSKLGINIRINNENKKLWNWIDSLIAPISYTMRYLFEKK